MRTSYLLGLCVLPILLSAQTFESLKTFTQFNSTRIEAVLFSPDNKTIIAGDSEGYLYLWDIGNGSLIKIIRAHEKGIVSASLSADMQILATAGNDNRIILWEVATWTTIKSTEISEAAIFMAFGKGKTIYYATSKTLYGADIDNLDNFKPVYQLRKIISNAVVSQSANKIGLSSGKNVYIYNLANGVVEQKIRCCKQSVREIDLSEDLIVANCKSGITNAWNIVNGEQIWSAKGSSGNGQIRLSRQDQFLVEGIGNLGRLKETENGNKVANLKGHNGHVSAFDFSIDNLFVLTGSNDGTVRVWRTDGVIDKKEVPSSPKDTLELVYSEMEIPTFLKGRVVEEQQTATISSSKLNIFVWDNESVDGDIISLNFNGEWILKDYSLTKVRKKITLDLNPNSNNYLILYAYNLGKNPPNTAAISFVSENNEKVLTLKSDLGKCGAVNFVFDK